MTSNEGFNLRIGILHFTVCEQHYKSYAYVSSECDLLNVWVIFECVD